MQKYQFFAAAVALHFEIEGRQYTTLVQGPNLFINDQAARDWCRAYVHQANSVTDPLRKPKEWVQSIEPCVLADAELDDYEYSPGWDVEVEVTLTKTLRVEIEPGTCDNETDAMLEAERMVNEGELEYEVERADVDNFEVDAQYAEEVE